MCQLFLVLSLSKNKLCLLKPLHPIPKFNFNYNVSLAQLSPGLSLFLFNNFILFNFGAVSMTAMYTLMPIFLFNFILQRDRDYHNIDVKLLKQAGAELGQAHIIVKVKFGYRMKRLSRQSLFFDKDKTTNG